MTDFRELTDEQVLEEAHRLARSVSYYNAAEGNWDRERREREACRREFDTVMREVYNRNMEFVNKGYLL